MIYMRLEVIRLLDNDKRKIIISNDLSEIKRTIIYLSMNQIYVSAIGTDVEEYIGISILNKPVIDLKTIIGYEDKYQYIISKDSKLKSANSTVLIDDLEISGSLERNFNANAIYRIIRAYENLHIIIWGYNEQSIDICRILEMLDVKVYAIIDDEIEAKETSNICFYPIQIFPIYELLNMERNTYIVIVTDVCMDHIEKLQHMGLKDAVDYTDAKSFHQFLSIDKCLDPILGYTYDVSSDNLLPGFVVFGNPNATRRIFIVGGSATDSSFDPRVSWPEYLYRLYRENNEDVVVYCGACAGYNSSQEMNKVLRDIVPLNPNIVISYSGYNDAFIKEPEKDNYIDYPYYMYFQIDMMDSLSQYVDVGNNNYKITQGYRLGTPNTLSRCEQYLNNIRSMYAISQEFEFDYLCFLQPCLVEKKDRWTKKEKNLFYNSNKTEKYCSRISEFYYEAKKFKTDYFINAVNVLDDISSTEEVFLDECHLNSRGNMEIACFVKDTIDKKGLL